MNRINSRPIGFANFSTVAAYCCLFAAMAGIFSVYDGRVGYALYFLLACGATQLAGGRIARARVRTTAEKKYGLQIESLCAMLSFGALPAFLFYVTSKHALPALFRITVPLMYALCAMVRQAYFNVAEELRVKSGAEPRTSYLGFPTALSALTVPMLWCLRPLMGSMFFPVFAILLFCLGLCFITPFVLKKPGVRLTVLLLLLGLATLITLIWETRAGLLS